MSRPADPGRSTGWPLGSRVKWGVASVRTSNVGVPRSKVRVKVSPEATAETIGGVPPVLVSGAGQEAEAGPDPVQSGTGDGLGEAAGEVALGVWFEVGVELQAHASITAAPPRTPAPRRDTVLQLATMHLDRNEIPPLRTFRVQARG